MDFSNKKKKVLEKLYKNLVKSRQNFFIKYAPPFFYKIKQHYQNFIINNTKKSINYDALSFQGNESLLHSSIYFQDILERKIRKWSLYFLQYIKQRRQYYKVRSQKIAMMLKRFQQKFMFSKLNQTIQMMQNQKYHLKKLRNQSILKLYNIFEKKQSVMKWQLFRKIQMIYQNQKKLKTQLICICSQLKKLEKKKKSYIQQSFNKIKKTVIQTKQRKIKAAQSLFKTISNIYNINNKNHFMFFNQKTIKIVKTKIGKYPCPIIKKIEVGSPMQKGLKLSQPLNWQIFNFLISDNQSIITPIKNFILPSNQNTNLYSFNINQQTIISEQYLPLSNLLIQQNKELDLTQIQSQKQKIESNKQIAQKNNTRNFFYKLNQKHPQQNKEQSIRFSLSKTSQISTSKSNSKNNYSLYQTHNNFFNKHNNQIKFNIKHNTRQKKFQKSNQQQKQKYKHKHKKRNHCRIHCQICIRLKSKHCFKNQEKIKKILYLNKEKSLQKNTKCKKYLQENYNNNRNFYGRSSMYPNKIHTYKQYITSNKNYK